MAYEFGRSPTYLKIIYTDAIQHLARRYRKILTWHPSLDRDKAYYFANVLKRFGGCTTIWGFVDGTFRGFCRSKYGQQFDYSGYKGHGFKWQGVVTPDGIIASLDGPYLGTANDSMMFRDSIVAQKIAEFWPADSEELYLFGDQAYGAIKGVMSPFRGGHTLDGKRRLFNDRMSSIRISVEQAFGVTQQKWMSNAFEIQMKGGLQPVAAYYLVSVLLTNCYTCMRGNCISSRFLTRPPTLEDYLNA